MDLPERSKAPTHSKESSLPQNIPDPNFTESRDKGGTAAEQSLHVPAAGNLAIGSEIVSSPLPISKEAKPPPKRIPSILLVEDNAVNLRVGNYAPVTLPN